MRMMQMIHLLSQTMRHLNFLPRPDQLQLGDLSSFCKIRRFQLVAYEACFS